MRVCVFAGVGFFIFVVVARAIKIYLISYVFASLERILRIIFIQLDRFEC